jgi:hypothetical protein
MEEMKMEIHNPEIKLPDKLLRKLESGREFRVMQFNAVDDNEKIVEAMPQLLISRICFGMRMTTKYMNRLIQELSKTVI